MSDEQNEVLENLADGLTVKKPGYLNVSMATLEPDWFLRRLVDFANRHGIETSVTLQVGGVQVTGMTISAEKYMRETAQLFGGSFTNKDLTESFTKLINGFADNLKPQEGDEDVMPAYIHLSNAHLYAPGGAIPKVDGMPILWRARISAIDGFFIGSSAPALAKPVGDVV